MNNIFNQFLRPQIWEHKSFEKKGIISGIGETIKLLIVTVGSEDREYFHNAIKNFKAKSNTDQQKTNILRSLSIKLISNYNKSPTLYKNQEKIRRNIEFEALSLSHIAVLENYITFRKRFLFSK